MTQPRLPFRAFAYVLGSIIAGAAATIVAAVVDPGIGDPWALAAFAAGAALAQLFLVQASPRLGYDISLAFLFAAVMILPSVSIALVASLMFIPVWARERYPWYMPVFNMANYALPALAAKAIVVSAPEMPGFQWSAYIAVATLLFTFLNHAILAGVLRLARGESVEETRLFSMTHFSLDTLVLCSGAAIAIAWEAAPVASLFAMLPLILIARALQIPRLEHESWTDSKTGLYNARFFAERGAEWCERAVAGRGVVSLAMIDLDFLRDINNEHGHLAGDAVIGEVAQVIRENARSTDMAARFGGEEFALLMPATTLEGGAAMAERVRTAVAGRAIRTEGVEVKATVSIGVACGPGTLEELIRRADASLYEAKAAGRNTVALAEPPADHSGALERRERTGDLSQPDGAPEQSEHHVRHV